MARLKLIRYGIASIIVCLITFSLLSSQTFAATAPDVPREVTAVYTSSNTVKITWKVPLNDGGSPITKYRIEHKEVPPANQFSFVGETQPNTLQYTEQSLTSGKIYIYRVFAINAIGEAVSTEVQAQQQSTAPPGTPVSPYAKAISPTKIYLSWTASSGNSATGYKIERKVSGQNFANLINVTNTLYNDTSISTGVVYEYRISAFNSYGMSGPSNIVTATPTSSSAASVAGAPTSLVATKSSSSQAILTWSAPADNGGSTIKSYKIERKTGSGNWAIIVTNTNSTTTTYTNSGLSTGDSYTYRVYTINGVGTSTSSNEAAITQSSSSTSVPSAPTGIVAKDVSPTQVNLTWKLPNGTVTGYKIERKIGAQDAYTVLVANTGNASTKYSDAGLETGRPVTYRIYAINSAGTSNPSKEVTGFPKSSSGPSVPTPPSGLIVKGISSTQVNMTWVAPIDDGGSKIIGYKITQKVGPGFLVVNDNTKSAKTSFILGGLTPGNTYTYRVAAINSAGDSTSSNEASVTLSTASSNTTPNSPTGVTVTVVSPTKISLSWTAPASSGSITGYKIERKIGSGNWLTIIPNTNSTNTSYADTGLAAGTYVYKISAINSVGTGSSSNEVSATIQSSTPNPPPVGTPVAGKVDVKNSDFVIRYTVTGGEVLDASADIDTFSLTIKMKTTSNGELILPLSRELIDAKKISSDGDDDFIVTVDGKAAQFTEKNRDLSRTLTIQIPTDTKEIKIYGTHIVPEFGEIAPIILVLSIISIIAVRNKITSKLWK